MRDKKIEVRVSTELLTVINHAAAAVWQSRSEWVRETIVLRLNKQDIVDQPDPDKVWLAEVERIRKQAEKDEP